MNYRVQFEQFTMELEVFPSNINGQQRLVCCQQKQHVKGNNRV